MKRQHLHTILLCQKPSLRQIEWGVQNGPITKNAVLPVTTLFFWKCCFRLRNSYKELIICTNHPNVLIHTFQKRWSFISGCFFTVSILKKDAITGYFLKITILRQIFCRILLSAKKSWIILTLPASRIWKSCINLKVNLNFYFHTSLWCLNRCLFVRDQNRNG